MTSRKRWGMYSLCTSGFAGILCGCLLIVGCETQPPGEKPAAEQQTPENATKRVTFQELFDVNGNMVTPKKVIRVSSITMTPDVPFESQVMMIDGAPFSQYIGRDADVKNVAGVWEIVRFY